MCSFSLTATPSRSRTSVQHSTRCSRGTGSRRSGGPRSWELRSRTPPSAPRPCGFWRDSGATWARGHRWRNARGKLVTDTGANLLKLLEDTNVDWLPLSRTNTRDLHPVLFAVYGDLVYHHGAGFRQALTRPEQAEIAEEVKRLCADGASADELRERLTRERIQRNGELSVRVYEEARADDQFWRRLFY